MHPEPSPVGFAYNQGHGFREESAESSDRDPLNPSQEYISPRSLQQENSAYADRRASPEESDSYSNRPYPNYGAAYQTEMVPRLNQDDSLTHTGTESSNVIPRPSSFHDFENIEEIDTDLLNAGGYKRERWWEKSHVMYYLDLFAGHINLSTIWRFPAVALAMSIHWKQNKVGLINFLFPYGVVLACVGWPILVAELGLAQITRGSGPRSFGSLGFRCRAPGMSWLMSIVTALMFASLASYAFVFMLESPRQMANYYSSATSSSVSSHRSCTKYDMYLPHIQPLLCQREGDRLDLSCLDPHECQLWAGNGRCIAVPWGPAAEYLLSNAHSLDPLLDNDHPQYCAARFLHDVTTNKATGVMANKAFWRDYGKFHHWKLIVGFVAVWIFAMAFCFAGDGIGRLLRLGSYAYAYVMLLVVTALAVAWFWTNQWVRHDWIMGMFKIQGSSLLRPEIWGAAVVQCLFSLGIGTNQTQTRAARAPSDKDNVVWTATWIMLINTGISYLSLWLVWLAYGAATSAAEILVENDVMLGTVKYDVRNASYGQLFTSLQTMFDNSAKLDGTAPRHWFIALMFWLAIAIFGINGVYHSLDAIVDPLFKSSLNWQLGQQRYVYVVGTVAVLFIFSILSWFGCSWGLFIISQHFLLNFALPLVVLYEIVSIGWIFGASARSKHYGRLAIWTQVVMYFAGCCTAAFCTVCLFDRPQEWKHWVGFLIGSVTMVSAAIFPMFCVKNHDVYGRRNDTKTKLKVVLFGSTDHLRKEFNYRSCHTALVMKLTIVWAILIKYVCPFALILAWGVCVARKEQNKRFSPYRPFYNDHGDLFSKLETALDRFDLLQAPSAFIALGWMAPFLIVLATPIFFVSPKWLDWMIPADTDPNFFNVRRAVELFAASPAQQQIPVRLREDQSTTTLYQSRFTADKMPSFTPSRSVMIDPPASRRDQSYTASEFQDDPTEASPLTGGHSQGHPQRSQQTSDSPLLRVPQHASGSTGSPSESHPTHREGSIMSEASNYQRRRHGPPMDYPLS